MQYAKYISQNEVQYPQAAEFAGVPNYMTNDAAMRKKGYMSLTDVPPQQDGKTLTLTGFELVTQSTSRTVTRYREVADYEKDEEGHQIEVGKHLEPYETAVEQDISYIRVTSYEYHDIPEPEPAPKPDVTQQLKRVQDLIATMAAKYHAEDAIMQLEEFSIPAVEKIIEDYDVSKDDKAEINYVVNFVVIDLMGGLQMTWYDIWNGIVKPALTASLHPEQQAAE